VITASSSSLQLSLAGLGAVHAVSEGPLLVDVSKLATPLTLVPSSTSGSEEFSIAHWGKFETDSFDSFSSFESQLATDLNGTTTVVGVSASGSYDGSGTFTATHIVVLLGS
jgi:hypothetical protein